MVETSPLHMSAFELNDTAREWELTKSGNELNLQCTNSWNSFQHQKLKSIRTFISAVELLKKKVSQTLLLHC